MLFPVFFPDIAPFSKAIYLVELHALVSEKRLDFLPSTSVNAAVNEIPCLPVVAVHPVILVNEVEDCLGTFPGICGKCLLFRLLPLEVARRIP